MATGKRDWYDRLNKIFRSGPSVKRRIRDQRQPRQSTAQALFSKTQSFVYSNAINAYGQYDRLSRYADFSEMDSTPEISSALDIYCLAGDNVIPLLDGRRVSIKQLFEDKEKNFWVYSYDIKTKMHVPGLCTHVVKTGTDQLIKRVVFDDGSFVRVTTEHLVLLKSGEYKRACDLIKGDKVESLYTKTSSEAKDDRLEGYEMIKVDDGWQYTHRIVASHGQPTGRGVVHHKDFRKWNNSPDNLEFMSWNAHKQLHARSNADRWRNNERYTEKMTKIFSEHAKTLHSLSVCGYNGWTAFVNANNHMVTEVIDDGIEDVFDLCVEEWHNFAVADQTAANNGSFVFVHNSEEAVTQDEHGRILHVFSENRKLKQLLEELFYDVLNIDFNLRMWTRNICKYGDAFIYNDIAPGTGVVQVFPIPINEVEREEGFDPEDPLATRFRWVTQGNVPLENWQVTHFRLLGNDAFLPYGSSVLEPARRIWRQLVLLEDAMLVYRVVRSPERRVFYVDVGGIPPEEVNNYMEQQERKLRSNAIVDRSSGRADFRHNPLETLEDYFIPVRGQESGTRIDTLSGGQHVSAIEDVEYIQKKLFAALKVPRAFLGYDEALSSKSTLAMEDIRFSRSVQHIQKVVLAELQKLAYIHLFMNGYDGDDMFDFELRLNNPSSVAQQQKLELYARKFEIVGNALGVADGQVFSTPYLLREIMDMSDTQQRELADQVTADVQRRHALSQLAEGETMESAGLGGGGGGGFGGGGGGDFGGDDMPDDASDLPDDAGGGDGEDAGGGDEGGDAGDLEDLFQGDEAEGELLVDVDDDAQSTGTVPRLVGGPQHDRASTTRSRRGGASPKLVGGPASTAHGGQSGVNVNNQVRQQQHNRRRAQQHVGPMKTGTPDFARSLSMRDPQDIIDHAALTFDNGSSTRTTAIPHIEQIKRAVAHVIGEAESDDRARRPMMSSEVSQLLTRLREKFGDDVGQARPPVIVERVELIDEDHDNTCIDYDIDEGCDIKHVTDIEKIISTIVGDDGDM